MEKYRFKVIVELKNNLTDVEKSYAKNYINLWGNKMRLEKIAENTYCKPIDNNQDLSSITVFGCKMAEKRDFFDKIQIFDVLDNYMESV